MKINLIKHIIVALSLGFAAVTGAQAQGWEEGGAACYWNSEGIKVCGSHHNYYPYDPYYHPYHGATTYKNVKGMKTTCHYDNHGHKTCQTYCNGMLC